VIIDPATLMNLSAQNALLKTLEEPPEDSLIILIASNAGALFHRALALFALVLRAIAAPGSRSLFAVAIWHEAGGRGALRGDEHGQHRCSG
jgi:hypothetical protein